MSPKAPAADGVDTVAPVSATVDASAAFSAEGQTLLAQLSPPPVRADGEPDSLDVSSPFPTPPVTEGGERTEQGERTGKLNRGPTDGSGRPDPVEVQPPFVLAETDSPNPPRQWTIAVQLTESVTHDNDQGERVTAGADSKVKSLQELAELTRGTPVTIYAQAAEPREQIMSPDGNSSSSSGPHYVATYRIENGEVTLVERRASEGFQQDLESLLGRASARAGDGNLGLIIQSHGFASDGVGGATGEVTLPELEDAIRNGLHASGRTALDVLNFDSCSMGNIDVAQAMQGEARHVVASSELEHTYGNDADGQNLRATLSALLANPNMTPAELAQTSVDLARAGVNGDSNPSNNELRNGTDTLAHYDLNSFPAVEKSMDGLGLALSGIATDPAQRAALSEVIAAVPHYEADMRNFGTRFSPERADLGLFLDALDSAVASGRLRDNDGSLRQAVNETRAALREFVPGYAGQPYNNYDRMSGVSIFLPATEAFNVDARAEASSPIGEMIDRLSAEKFTRIDHKEDVASEVERYLADTRAALPSVDTSMFDASLTALRQANTQREMDIAVQQLLEQARKFQSSPAGQAGIERERPAILAARDKMYDEQLQRSPQQWQAFLNLLRGRS